MSRTRKILSIKVEHLPDYDAPTDWIGEYTDDPDPYNFDRQERKMLKTLERDRDYEMPERGREYRFFKPQAGGEEPGSRAYIKYGKQDLDRMEGLEKGEWSFLGIVASAKIQTGTDIVQKIHSGGLWGIESDSDNGHISEVEQEELASLKKELRAVGFTDHTIDTVEIEEVKP